MRHELSRAGVVCLQLHLGGDRNFCYLLGDAATGAAAAIDPGHDAAEFQRQAVAAGLKIERILVTHGHADHIGALAELAALTGASIHAGAEAGVTGAVPAADGDRLSCGALQIEILATPGHAPGHLCFLAAGFLVSGDLLFCGKIGGTGSYFPGSSPSEQFQSLRRLMQLPPATVVLPGHDYYGGPGQMPHSTIGYEAAHNPFLKTADLAGFQHLKDNWAAYKKEHNLR